MALGTYDANGIWHYGESDNIALFSDTLNKLADSASSAITADRSRLSTLEAGSLAGVIPVKPGSITAVTGTATMTTLGVVNMTGVTKIQLQDVLNKSQFSHYMVRLNVTNGTTAGFVIQTRLMKSTGEDATGAYAYNFILGAGNSTSLTVYNAVGATQIADTTSYPNYACVWELDIHNPNAAVFTTGTYKAVNYRGGSGVEVRHGGFSTLDASLYTGISLFCTSGTMSGTVQVFGYNG